MQVIYFVRWIVKPGKEQEAIELVNKNFAHIDQEESGNVCFITHQSVENPREFWMYEVWENQEAVDAHEGSTWFEKEYKAHLRPIVDPDSIVFGNARILNQRRLA